MKSCKSSRLADLKGIMRHATGCMGKLYVWWHPGAGKWAGEGWGDSMETDQEKACF